MVYGIVSSMTVTLIVYSEVGMVTTFKSSADVERSVEKSRAGNSNFLARRNGDDSRSEDEEGCEIWREILEGLGYTVLLRRMARAVDLYKVTTSDIDRFTGCMMPHMGGIEAYERSRELALSAMILMTGYSAATVQSRSSSKVNSWKSRCIVLQKPYNVEGLGRKIVRCWINPKKRDR